MQNSAARLLTGTRKHEHISPILRSFHCLPIPRIIDFKLLLLTFKSLNDEAPPYMEELLFVIDEQELCVQQLKDS